MDQGLLVFVAFVPVNYEGIAGEITAIAAPSFLIAPITLDQADAKSNQMASADFGTRPSCRRLETSLPKYTFLLLP